MLGDDEVKGMTTGEVKAKLSTCGDTLKLWGMANYTKQV